jgi:1,4-dihydroxy-2-naphthoate octaprenyltransferase
MTHLFAEFRHRLASGSRTPALLCFLGLSCLGLEAVGFVFHREGEILPLVLVILLSAIPFAIAVFYVAKSKRFPHGSLTVILLFGVLMRIGSELSCTLGIRWSFGSSGARGTSMP